MNSDLASPRGHAPVGLLAFLGRLVGFSMVSREKEWSGRDNRVYVSLDAFHANPVLARAHVAAGRQVVVEDAEGRLLFVLGLAAPDPFPPTEDELPEVPDFETATSAPGFNWLQ